MTTSPRLFAPERRAAYERVENVAKLPRYGGDCYAYCALAAGHVDLVIEDGLNPYDIVALIPIVEGAGGIVTTWDGGDATNGGSIIAAGEFSRARGGDEAAGGLTSGSAVRDGWGAVLPDAPVIAA